MPLNKETKPNQLRLALTEKSLIDKMLIKIK